MLMDKKWAFQTSGGSEAFATSGTTQLNSDYIDTRKVPGSTDNPRTGYADGGKDLYLYIQTTSTAGSAAKGASFQFDFADSADGSTFAAVASKTVALATANAVNTMLWRYALPAGIRRYIRVQATGAASMTGAINFNAWIATS
jgi:hypothetical protein